MNNSFRTQLQSIVENLNEKFSGQGFQDVDIILQAGINSVDDLLTALPKQDVNENTRAIICWFLSKLRDERAFIPLLATLKHRNPELRIAAARALGELNSEQAVQPLIDVLQKDENIEVRIAAAYGLGCIGDRRAVEPMLDILSDRNLASKLRGMVAEALFNIGDRRAVSPLILSLSDESVELRFWASFALGELGDSQAIPELERLAATDETVLPGWGSISREATKAIQQIRDRENL